MSDYPPVALYIIENPTTKTFYTKRVNLKYKYESDGNIIITSHTSLKNKYKDLFYQRNNTLFGSGVLCSHVERNIKNNPKLKTLFTSGKPIITGFLFNAKMYPCSQMFDYGQNIHNITRDEILKRIKEYKKIYEIGYMDWQTIETKTITKNKWVYVKRGEPYECINIRNVGLTQKEKNKNKYEKKKQKTDFKVKINRKQVLINIKKRGKQPKNSTIDKYGITEDEIKNIV
tara:strand:- start:73 stop:762 length:690 start_codon:yes stop_codon:yes gene_type:complete